MAWNAKPTGAYARDSAEAISNATEIKTYLLSEGWTLNAICGMLGNNGYEGGYNPWRWQNDIILDRYTAETYEGFDHGYGMYGWTPSNRYINSVSATYPGYAPNCSDTPGNASDGQAQVYWVAHRPDQFFPARYSPYQSWTDFNDYITSTYSAEFLAELWMYNWEKPAEQYAISTKAGRRAEGKYWWDYFEGGPTPPDPPVPPPIIKPKKFKWWMYMPLPW